MGIIKKQSVLNSLINYTGIVLGFITTIYLYPRIFDTEQYGLTRLLLSVSFVFTQFAHLGIKNISIKYFPFFQDKKNHHNGFFFIILLVPFLGMLLFLLIFILFDSFIIDFYSSENSVLFVSYYWYIIPLVFSILYFIVLDSYIRALFNSIPGSLASEIIIRVSTIILLLLYSFQYLDFEQFMIGFVGSYFLQPLYLIIHLINIGEFRIKLSLSIFKIIPAKELISFGFFGILGGISSILVNNIDIIMLGSLSGLTETGIYAIAFYVGSVIVVPKKSIAKIAPTLVAKHLKEGDLDEIEKIYKSSSINQLLVGVLIYIGVWANLDNLFSILPSDYSGGELVVLIIGAAKLIDMAAGINGVIILNSKYYRFDLYSIVFLIALSVALNYTLIPIYGISGAAIATFTSILIYNIIKCVYLWKKYHIQPLTNKVPWLLITGALVLVLFQFLPKIGGTYSDIAVRSILITALFSLIIYKLKISEDINLLIRQVLRRAKLIT
ncbi:MAG: oligosaccharide flippase family protein [Balneolaceae bacterium]